MDPINPDEMKIDSRLAGGRSLGQIRCSRKEQAKKSLPQQREWLRTFAELNKMLHVDDMKEAVSASQIRRRPDLDRIFERKRLVNDFDTLIVQDLSRLTRGGATHGLQLLFKFKDVGIRLVSIVDGLIDGDETVLKAAQRFQEARATAKAIALNSRRGQLAARRMRKNSYTFNIPFGIDRLIVTEDATPLFRLRNMGDGSQQKLSPDGKTLLHTYPPNGVGERNHHKKQAHEFERLAPGDDNHVKLVNRMYRFKFKDRRNDFRISRLLNDEGLRTLRGNPWSREAVYNILVNSVYLNRAIGDQTAAGEFYMNGPSYPLPVVKEEGPLAIYRPEDDWYHEKHDPMESFLEFDAATKEEIYQWQLSQMRRRAERQKLRRGGNRHHQSAYLLSGILREKTQQWFLTGSSKGGYRWYRASRAERCPFSGHWLNRHFSAKILEAPIRPVLKEVLDSYGGILSATEAAATSFLQAQQANHAEMPSLLARREELLGQMDFWISQLKELGRAYVTSKTTPLKEEIVAVGRRIKSFEEERNTRSAHGTPDSPKLKDAIRQVAEQWDDLPMEAIRSILRILVAKMEIDYETNEVDLELRLPSWAATKPDVFLRCLEKDVHLHGLIETHSLWSVPLACYRFQYQKYQREGMTLISSKRTAA